MFEERKREKQRGDDGTCGHEVKAKRQGQRSKESMPNEVALAAKSQR